VRKTIPFIIFIFVAYVFSAIGQQTRLPLFDDYRVPLYRGKIHKPAWSRHTDDMWVDDLGKLSEEPKINFAGKYFITTHTCGSGCASYSMTDLSNGRELRVLEPFWFTEFPQPKTRDGHEYTTGLFYRPASKILVAQFYIDLGNAKTECRERIFVFEKGKLKPITDTRHECQKLSEPS
jgi:hypothetical protein